MRVALVYQYFNLAGSLERERVLLAKALLALGVEVACYADPHGRSDVPGVTFHDVVPRIRSQGRVGRALEYGSFAFRATRLLRREREAYDIVDVSGTTAWEHDVVRVHAVQRSVLRRWPTQGGASFRAARLRATLAPVAHPKTGLAEAIERLQYRPGHFRRALAVTEEVRRDLREVHRVPDELIEVLHYPVDLARFEGANGRLLRSQAGLPEDATLLLFIGHDFERKGLAEALEALAALPDHAHLAVVGDGDREPFARLAAGRGIAARVHFLGGTTVPEELLPGADVLVLPTREDIWGVVLVEAMAAGVPIVTTDGAGAAEVVRSAGAGLVVPSGSSRELREALAALVADPEKRAELGRRGPAAAARFGVAQFARAVLSAYEAVLAGGKRS